MGSTKKTIIRPEQKAARPAPRAAPATGPLRTAAGSGKNSSMSQVVIRRRAAIPPRWRVRLVWMDLLLDRRPISGSTRMTLCEGRTAPHSPEGHRLSATCRSRDNERVSTGQVLARIDRPRLQVALDQAKGGM